MLVFPALVLPFSRKMNMGMAQVLELSFWMYLLFGLTALPWGLAADRWGSRALMGIYFMGAGISAIIAAFNVDSPVRLCLALAGVGFFSGIYHPAGLGMISKGVTRISVALGYNGMFGNLGLALAPLLTGLINWMWGPRAAFLVMGIMNLAGISLVKTIPSSTEHRIGDVHSENGKGLLVPFLILLVVMMMSGVVYRGATVIMPTYLELKSSGIHSVFSALRSEGITGNLVATIITSIIYALGIMGQYIGGRTAERFEPRLSYLVFHGICIPVAILMALTSDILLVVLSVTYFFFLLGAQPIENTLIARLTPSRFRHSAYGTKFILTFGVGAFAVKMVGGINTAWGIEAIFVFLGTISMALVGVILILINYKNTVQGKIYY